MRATVEALVILAAFRNCGANLAGEEGGGGGGGILDPLLALGDFESRRDFAPCALVAFRLGDFAGFEVRGAS